MDGEHTTGTLLAFSLLSLYTESVAPNSNTAEDIAAPNGIVIVEDKEAPNDVVAASKIEEPVVQNAGAGEEEEAKEKGIEEEEAKEKERRWITRCKDGRVCGKEGQQGELGILKG